MTLSKTHVPVRRALLRAAAALAAAPRTERAGTPPGEQFCHNCRFIQTESGEWRPCQIFPGKAVHETGWCASWTAKS